MVKVTMKDIAQRAGVTGQTVSGIIKDKYYKVSPATRTRVMKLVNEMNYHPNHSASSLRGGKRFCIGVAGGAHLEEMDDLAVSRIYSGIGRVVEQHNNYMMFLPQAAGSVPTEKEFLTNEKNAN